MSTYPRDWLKMVGQEVEMVLRMPSGRNQTLTGTLSYKHGHYFINNAGGWIDRIKSITPTPTKPMETEFKPGMTTVINGKTWTRMPDDAEGTFNWACGDRVVRLADAQIRSMDCIVTSPKKPVVIAEFHFPDGKYNGQDLPLSFKGEDLLAVKKMSVVHNMDHLAEVDSGAPTLGQIVVKGLKWGHTYRVLVIDEGGL